MDLHRWIQGFPFPDPPCEISSKFAGGIARITPKKPHGLGLSREVEDEVMAVDSNQRHGLHPAVSEPV
ncbi:hypothetical protein MA16_Dca023646 [Dendrobium catenatum]|uniref:Uncharacterized protein n=1 Tax=Dendrobium catenatum TaxID=906689 RepID=A0A2I0WVJ8_9ASPA|nr:hypothetical protein MA16_Dca023646 [Dendrobium catenatum]